MQYTGFVAALVLAGAGCQMILGIEGVEGGSDAGLTDAWRGDGGADAAEPCLWAARGFDPCALPWSDDELELTGRYRYDTDAMALVRDGSADPEDHDSGLIVHDSGTAVAIVAGRVSIGDGAELRVVGTRPLVIVAWDDIRIEGLLDAGSRRDEPGAGARALCLIEPGVQGSTAAHDNADNGGGGGGGGFGNPGGAGGAGGGFSAAPGGAGGGAEPLPALIAGGCPGASGGQGVGVAGPAGHGGGGVVLAARDRIRVSGRVLAGGAGGGGGVLGGRDGGGGGGSGGMIALDAPEIEISGTAVLAANGGGGGEGSDVNEAGAAGQDGELAGSPTPGGGSGADLGGDGGSGGSAGSQNAGDGASGDSAFRGGGGGGGGAGYVVIPAGAEVGAGAVISPAPRSS